jgi:hypothetical protein
MEVFEVPSEWLETFKYWGIIYGIMIVGEMSLIGLFFLYAHFHHPENRIQACPNCGSKINLVEQICPECSEQHDLHMNAQ